MRGRHLVSYEKSKERTRHKVGIQVSYRRDDKALTKGINFRLLHSADILDNHACSQFATHLPLYLVGPTKHVRHSSQENAATTPPQVSRSPRETPFTYISHSQTRCRKWRILHGDNLVQDPLEILKLAKCIRFTNYQQTAGGISGRLNLLYRTMWPRITQRTDSLTEK